MPRQTRQATSLPASGIQYHMNIKRTSLPKQSTLTRQQPVKQPLSTSVMSADNDSDSQMLSSPSSSDLEGQSRTDPPQTSILSPPDSQHRSAMPTSATGSAIANANGKRPINTISNGADETDDMQAAGSALGSSGGSGAGKARAEFATKTHQQSGYQWNRAEDEPGYAWLNKKALDEYHRAFDGLVHRDYMVKGTFRSLAGRILLLISV